MAPSILACDDNDTVLRTLVYTNRRHVEQRPSFFSLPFLTCLSAVSFARVLPCTLGTATLETVLGDTVGQTFASLTRSCIVSKSFCTRHLRVVRCPRNVDVTVTFLLPACWELESPGMDFLI